MNYRHNARPAGSSLARLPESPGQKSSFIVDTDHPYHASILEYQAHHHEAGLSSRHRRRNDHLRRTDCSDAAYEKPRLLRPRTTESTRISPFPTMFANPKGWEENHVDATPTTTFHTSRAAGRASPSVSNIRSISSTTRRMRQVSEIRNPEFISAVRHKDTSRSVISLFMLSC